MPLGTDVGLRLRNIVFDVDPAIPRKKGTSTPPNFGPCLLWPNGWMDEDAAWYGTEVDIGPGHIVLDGVPAPAKGAQQPPLLGHVYCGHGRPSQLLLGSCILSFRSLDRQSVINLSSVYRQSEKLVKRQHLFHMSLQYGELRPTNV